MTKKATSARNIEVSQTEAAERAGVQKLGLIVWADVIIGDRLYSRADIRSHLLSHGLPEDIQDADLSPQAAFGNALGRTRLADGWKIEREEKRSRSALLFRQTGKGTGRVDHAQVLLSAGDSGIETIPDRASLTQEQADVLAPLDAQYAKAMSYVTPSELQETVREAITKWFGGVRIREHSGTFWTPREAESDVRAFRLVVEQLGGTRMVCLPVHDLDGMQQEIGRDVATGFDREVADLVAKLGEDGTTSARGLEARADDLRELKARVAVARYVLASQADRLADALADAQSAVEERIALLAKPDRKNRIGAL